MNINIKIGTKTFTAYLEDNKASQAFINKLPLTFNMHNLYGRELCFRMGAGSLPTDSLRSNEYEIGDIVYWPPMGSIVILYEQNGEHFSRQHLGHIYSLKSSDLKNINNCNVTFFK